MFICLVLCTLRILAAKTINVDPIHGIDNINCISGNHPCKRLDYVFLKGNRNLNSTNVYLSLGSHMLNNDTRFKYVYDFTLMSVSNSVIVNCSQENAGISFYFSGNISFVNVTIQNCGVKHRSTTVNRNDPKSQLDHPFVRVAVYFAYCRSINITAASFIHNQGIAIAMYDVNGHVIIHKSQFISNSDYNTLNDTANMKYISGGGIYIEFTYCGALDPFSCTSLAYQKFYNHDSRYSITDCLFHSNYAESNYSHSFPDIPQNKSYISFGRGAGLSVNILGDGFNNVFLIQNCRFINNSALWGGALYISFKDFSQHNSVVIKQTNFTGNIATYAGGGIRADSIYLQPYASYSQTIKSGNKLSFQKLIFERNCAIWGGGLSIISTTRMIYSLDPESRTVEISDCKFFKNLATVGFAIGLSTINLNTDAIGSEMSYRVNLNHSFFEGNTMKLTEDKKVTGQGAIYSEEVTLVLFGQNKFYHNGFTAVVLDSSSLTLSASSITIFYQNHGLEGGALALYGNSWITFEERSTVTFENNQARRKGGAIYVKSSGPPRVSFETTELQSSACFLRYYNDRIKPNSWKTKILFKNNSAPIANGNSIYASTLQYCRSPGEKCRNSSALSWNVIEYEDNVGHQPEIVTNAVEITVNPSLWKASPYIPFSPDVYMLDEKGQSVYGSVKVDVMGYNSNVSLDPPNSIFLIRNKLSRIRLTGKVNSEYSVQLLTTSGQMVDTIKYNATLNRCPAGFRDVMGKCVCMADEHNDVVHCLENGTVYVLRGVYGFVNNKTGLLETVTCPPHYCACSSVLEDYVCELNLKNQCAKKRTGLLCSQCEEGLSVVLGSEQCKKCSNHWLFMLIPMLLCLFIAVNIILYLNIDAFSGYLNAYLYSYQMIVLLIPENVQLDNFIAFVIGITGLSGTGGNFGICLFDGMNNLQKLVFNYVSPVCMVLFTIIMGIAIPEKLWHKIFFRKSTTSDVESEARRRSFGRALSFVFVVCYSSFTGITLKLLHWSTLDDGKSYVVYEAAFSGFFHGQHLYYGIFAVFILFFVVLLFPIVLLFTPFFTYRFWWIQRLEPVLNTLKNCFKDRTTCRMFAAYYFICRLCLLAIAVFIPEEVTRLIVLTIACVLFQAFFTWVQPYRYRSYNFWDILLLTNMCVISLLSLILKVPSNTSLLVRKRMTYMLRTLIYIPLISIVLRFISYAYHRLQRKSILDETDAGIYLVIVLCPNFKLWLSVL